MESYKYTLRDKMVALDHCEAESLDEAIKKLSLAGDYKTIDWFPALDGGYAIVANKHNDVMLGIDWTRV